MTTNPKASWLLLAIVIWSAAGSEEGNDLHPWARMAQIDLDAAYGIIEENHPGVLDEASPQFRAWLDSGYREARARLGEVHTRADYEYLLRYFVNGFRDAHLSVQFEAQPTRVAWPGFLLEWRGDHLAVARDDDGTPPSGARLEHCGDRDAGTLLEERVFPWRGTSALPAHRYLYAPYTLVELRGRFEDLPRTCTFSFDNHPVTVELPWRFIAFSELAAKLEGTNQAPTGQPSIRPAPDNGAWLSLPSFLPGGSASEGLEEVLQEVPRYRDSEYLVVDLRGNRGGSSWWTKRILGALYGESYAELIMARVRPRNEYAEHRVSEANLAHWERILPHIREENGPESDVYAYARRLVESMREALERGEELVRDPVVTSGQVASMDGPTGDAEPAWNGRLYLLTDAGCVSACLDFMDAALELPDVTHVGQPTSADSDYLEVRGEDLPSGNARLFHATKVVRNRARGHNEYYEPERSWNGDIADTQALTGWIRRIRSSE